VPTQVIGRRVAAYLIDAIGVGIVMLVVFLVLAHKVPKDTATSSVSSSLKIGDSKYTLSGGRFVVYALLYAAVWIVGRALFESRLGATPGKLALGLRVVDRDGGTRPELRTTLIRNLMWVVDALPYVFGPIAGFIAMLVSESDQRLGDRVAGTLVVRAEADAPVSEGGDRWTATPAGAATPAAPGAPAPGWYADPRGERRLRWWDGAAWTDDVAD
jgi:uncharacterized RDD family membrane protein YckC